MQGMLTPAVMWAILGAILFAVELSTFFRASKRSNRIEGGDIYKSIYKDLRKTLSIPEARQLARELSLREEELDSRSMTQFMVGPGMPEIFKGPVLGRMSWAIAFIFYFFGIGVFVTALLTWLGVTPTINLQLAAFIASSLLTLALFRKSPKGLLAFFGICAFVTALLTWLGVTPTTNLQLAAFIASSFLTLALFRDYLWQRRMQF